VQLIRPTCRHAPHRSAFAGFRFPPEVIVLAGALVPAARPVLPRCRGASSAAAAPVCGRSSSTFPRRSATPLRCWPTKGWAIAWCTAPETPPPTTSEPRRSTSCTANAAHHFDEPTNRDLARRAARALRPGGFFVIVDFVRPRSPRKAGQVGTLKRPVLRADQRRRHLVHRGAGPMAARRRIAATQTDPPAHRA